MGKKFWNVAKYVLSLALALLLVWLVVRKIDWKSFLEGLRNTRWVYMPGFTAAGVFALVFRALRWNQLLKPLDGATSFMDCWDANNIGNLGSLVIPGSCEPIRAGLITSKKLPFQTVFGTMIMERAWDFLYIFLTIVIALVLKLDTFGGFVSDNIIKPIVSSTAVWLILTAAVILVAALIWACFRYRTKVKFFDRIATLIEGVVQGFRSFGKMKNKLPYIIYTTMIWVMYMFMCYFCLKAIPELSGLDMADALFLSAIGNVASVIPVPGGIGAYHYLVMLCISSLYGLSNETGLLFATLNHEGHAVIILALGIISYLARMIRKKK
ncbi:MAG: flippase-like domain-containing protein [Bacteroidales bacterium]|nr:flippase-like domain-containing protein [Bacteroidales bacterium]